MKPFIPHQRSEWPPAERGVQPEDYEAVTLDRVLEYPVILPIVRESLRATYHRRRNPVARLLDSIWVSSWPGERARKEKERRSQITRRLGYIASFQQDVGVAPYDEERSINLTHDEAHVAADALAHTPDDMRSGVVRLRTQLSAGIHVCLVWHERLRQLGIPTHDELRGSEDE